MKGLNGGGSLVAGVFRRQRFPFALIRYQGTNVIDYKTRYARLVKIKIVGHGLTSQIIPDHFLGAYNAKRNAKEVSNT